MDARDLQRRWQEVVKTCVREHNSAPPSEKERWVEARKAAQAMADSLVGPIQAEEVACEMWRLAREKTAPGAAKPKPVLKIVS